MVSIYKDLTLDHIAGVLLGHEQVGLSTETSELVENSHNFLKYFWTNGSIPYSR